MVRGMHSLIGVGRDAVQLRKAGCKRSATQTACALANAVCGRLAARRRAGGCNRGATAAWRWSRRRPAGQASPASVRSMRQPTLETPCQRPGSRHVPRSEI
eukprot:scaffold70921_cov64-Phaeocystis_antarctica.AAC.2